MYGLCILNGRDVIVHIQHLYPEDDISVHDKLLRVESYPEFPERRTTSPSTVAEFSRHANPMKSKGMPKIIELSASEESMSRLWDW
jgi:hypothetical protein